MYVRYLLVMVLAVASMLLFSASEAAAQNSVPRFCYRGVCHASLGAAEAAMREHAGLLGPYIRKDSSAISSGNSLGVFSDITYIVPNQVPVKWNPPIYVIDGWDSSTGICTPSNDPLHPGYCIDKDEMVEGYFQSLKRSSPQCQYTNEGIVGSFATPFAYLRSSNGIGIVGTTALNVTEKLTYTIQCPGWPAPDARYAEISRNQTYMCNSGFWPEIANNPIYHGSGTLTVEWPLICTAGNPKLYIQVQRVTQTKSCEVNANPCYPATGDKAREEVDFEFAGQPFARYYHSLGQIQSPARLGINWSHTYSDFLASPHMNLKTRVSEQGYLQTFTSEGRGDQSSGDVLIKTSGSTGTLRQADGTRRHYTVDGVLVAVETGTPATSVSLSYTSAGALDSVTDGAGRSLRFAYAGGYLKSIMLPDGAIFHYTHDSQGNLTSVQRPDGSVRSYLYAESGLVQSIGTNLMTGIANDSERYASFSYSADERVLSSALHIDAGLVDEIKITYNTDGSASSIGNLGQIKKYAIGGGQYRGITGIEDSLGSRSIIYDAQGRMTSKTDPLGNVTTLSYTDYSSGPISQVVTRTEESIGRVSRVTRDANNRVVEQRTSQKIPGGEELSTLSRQVHDAQGRLLFACQYDVKQPADYVCGSVAAAPANVRQIQNTYCTEAEVAATPALCPLAGLQLSERDPAGVVTRFEYYAANDAGCDGSGNCRYRKGDLSAEIDALGRRTEYLEYDAAGRSLQVRGIDGRVVEQLYDAVGRVLSETLKGDAPSNDRIRLYEYNSAGQVTRIVEPDGAWTRMHYDTANRLVAVEDATGNRINYVLDAAGNQVREEVRDSSGALKSFLDRTFDISGRMITIAGAAGHATQLRYDANSRLLTSEDPLGTVSSSSYDGSGRPIRKVDDVGGINAETRYEYAANGQIERVFDAKGLQTTYLYDGFGQLETQVSPDTGTTRFTYDRRGDTLTRTDARGVMASHAYDAIGRRVSVRYADPAADVQYVYDQPSALCQAGERAGAGRLASVIDGSGRTDYCYNAMGDLVRRVQQAEGQALVLRYVYVPSGRLRSMTYPDGSVVDYEYDALGQASSLAVTPVGGARQVLLRDTNLLPFGPQQSWTYGNGRTLDSSFDMDYRPVSISDGRDGLDVRLGFDSVGNITSLADKVPLDQGAVLNYDALGRLTAFKDAQTGVAIEQYSYDATGNRLTFSNATGVQQYMYAPDSHRLMAVDGLARTYDAAGNTLNIGSEWEYAYDLANRLGAATRVGAAQVVYRHNAAGQRVLQQTGAERIFHLHGEGGEWLGSYDANGVPSQQVVWLGSRPVGLIQAGKVLYVEPDHLGTPRTVIDPERDTAVWHWSLLGEGFGSGLPAEDPDQDGLAQKFDLRFPGQRSDHGSGLNYNYFRDYDPSTGRYAESDPLGLAAGGSTYGYVSGQPIGMSDPLGLVQWDGTVRGAGLSAGIGGGIYLFSLTSECVNGERATAEVIALGPMIGVGAKSLPPVAYTTSEVKLNDKLSRPDPNVLNGWFSMWMAGAALGRGYSVAMIQLGGSGGSLQGPEQSGAWTHFSHGPTRGFEFGAGGISGSSTVTKFSKERCECN